MSWQFVDKESEKIVVGTLEDCIREYADLYHLDYEQESVAGSLLDMILHEAKSKGVVEDNKMFIENLKPEC